MLLFRSLTLGLLGACFYLLLGVARQGEPLREVQLAPATTIVDIAGGVRGEQLAGMLALAPGERIVAVDDRPMRDDLQAGLEIAAREGSPGTFVDLTVESAAGARRVLLLRH